MEVQWKVEETHFKDHIFAFIRAVIVKINVAGEDLTQIERPRKCKVKNISVYTRL